MKFGKTPNVEPEKSSDYSFVCFWFLPSLPQKGFFTQYTNHKDIQKMPSEVAERAHQYRKRLPTTKLRLRPPGLLCPVATASTRHAHPHTHSTLAFAAPRPLVALPQQHRKQQHPSLRARAQRSLPLPIPRSRAGTRNRAIAPAFARSHPAASHSVVLFQKASTTIGKQVSSPHKEQRQWQKLSTPRTGRSWASPTP